MKSVTFVPSIGHQSLGIGYIAKVPSDVRKQAWNHLFDIQDKIITIKKDTGPTELWVHANPGYKPEEALAILAVSIHLAQHNLKDLLSYQSYEKHLQIIKENISFENDVALAPSAIEPYIDNFIIDRITKLVKNQADNIHHGIRMGWIDSQIEKIQVVKRALEYLPKFPIVLWPWEKSERIHLCNQALKTIQDFRLQAENVNKGIASVHTEIKTAVENFLLALNLTPVNVEFEYEKVMTQIAEAQVKCRYVFNYLDTDTVEMVVNSIENICPPSSK